MEIHTELADELKNRTQIAEEVLRLFCLEFRQFVIIPFEHDKKTGRLRKGGLRNIARKEAYEAYFDNSNPRLILAINSLAKLDRLSTYHRAKNKLWINVNYNGHNISIEDLFIAFQICADNGWAIPFEPKFVTDAIDGLKSGDARKVFIAAEEMKKQVNRFCLARKAQENTGKNTDDGNPTNYLGIEFEKQKVVLGNASVDFHNNVKALDIVKLVVSHGSEGVSRQQVFQEIWEDTPVAPNNLDQQKKKANQLLRSIGLMIGKHPENKTGWMIIKRIGSE